MGRASVAPRPLDGIRVLDLSRLLPGPYLTLLMQDMGATVIKIEDPKMGDYMRWSPPMRDGVSQVFAVLNRGKKSVGLDLKDEADRAILLNMAKHADVLVESFRPGVLERLGCSPSTLLELNPKLIILSISGFGQEGPLCQRAGHDLNFLARSGLLYLNRDQNAHPVVPGFQSADIAGGPLLPLTQLLARLYSREKTGEGGHIDASMMHGVMSLAALPFAELMGEDESFDPADAVLAGSRACYGVYETSDGRHMALGALEPKFWKGFCAAMNRPDWLARHLSTGEEGATLKSEICAAFKENPLEYWVNVFSEVDVCCEPVLTPREALSVKSGHISLTHATSETGPVMLLSPTQTMDWEATDLHVPALGEHRDEVLAMLEKD